MRSLVGEEHFEAAAEKGKLACMWEVRGMWVGEDYVNSTVRGRSLGIVD